MNIVKEINVKNIMQYFLYDMINVENLDSNKIKIDKYSHKNILTCYISCVTRNSVKLLYFIINEIND